VAADRNLRLEEPRAAASGAFARLRQATLVEREPARSAARGLDLDHEARGLRRSQGMTQIVLDVAALQTQLARQRRYGSRLAGNPREQLAAQRHDPIPRNRQIGQAMWIRLFAADLYTDIS